jgi:hypothetical protein
MLLISAIGIEARRKECSMIWNLTWMMMSSSLHSRTFQVSFLTLLFCFYLSPLSGILSLWVPTSFMSFLISVSHCPSNLFSLPLSPSPTLPLSLSLFCLSQYHFFTTLSFCKLFQLTTNLEWLRILLKRFAFGKCTKSIQPFRSLFWIMLIGQLLMDFSLILLKSVGEGETYR